MKQVLHIFGKDVRHYWVEIAVSLALMVAFGHYEVSSWNATDVTAAAGSFFGQGFWSGLVMFLTPVAWCFLMVRIVHEESLVGDREFWVTRPYEWRKLLGSKMVFVLAPSGSLDGELSVGVRLRSFSLSRSVRGEKD